MDEQATRRTGEFQPYSGRFAALETAFTNLDHRLYGNGQPGDIQQIKAKLDGVLRQQWMIVGAGAVLAFLVPIAVQMLTHHGP